MRLTRQRIIVVIAVLVVIGGVIEWRLHAERGYFLGDLARLIQTELSA